VIELNGAVDFRPLYALGATDVYADTTAALAGERPQIPPAAAQIS
jgi:hypothetical protein